MRVITDHARTYPEDPARHFDFARFAGQTAGDFAFFAGLFDFKALDSVPADKQVVFLELEEPNRFLVPASAADFHHLDRDERFAKVFTLCPFTADWLNRRHGDERWAPSFFPFNERHTPAPCAKEFDVIYTGGVHAAGIERLIHDLAPFNFRFVSQLRHPAVTDFNCSYHEKLSLIARSRVTLVHNQLFVTRQQIENVARHPRWRENVAFAQLPLPGSPELLAAAPDQTWPAPQLKSRLFEAAFCRSLILCQRDPWNLVERFFTPGEEFVYFEPGRLAETLRAVLADYPRHAAIAERAHQRAVREYSTTAFFTKFLRNLHPAPAAKPKVSRHEHLPAAEDFLTRLQQARLWQPGQPLRLHLGCGERRFDGYVNVDFPPAEHTVQASVAADIFADILTLDLPAGSVDEVRLHHVFEHFDRPTALALLCRWHRWLRPAGRLTLETPDADASARLLADPCPSHAQKQVVLRHLFGSHEAAWAVHYDGWYPAKFQRVLGALGFGEVQCELGEWQMTRNVTASAVKIAERTPAEQTAAAAELLRDSLVDHSASEQKLHAIWMSAFGQRYAAQLPAAPSVDHGSAAPPVTSPKPKAENLKPPAPLVSIFIPAYNREKYLPATLESLLAQSFRDVEIIVADDGSTDRTLAVARDYAQRDPRIRVLALPHRGEVAARNEAVMAARPDSRYLLNHDSDDLSLPDKLARLVAHLEAHPEIAAVGCLAEYFDDAGQDLGRPPLAEEPARIRATFGELNSMVNSATLVRRTVFERVGPYREAFRSVDDYDFFARALLAGFELANLPEVLHRIRLHPASVGSTRAARQDQLATVIRAAYRAGRAATRAEAEAATRREVRPSNHALRPAASSRRLNLLHTVEFYAPHTGGAEAVVQQLSERLARRGHRVTVATTRLPERAFAELNGVVIADFAVSGKLAEGIHGEFARYQQFLREHDCDVMMNYAAQQWATDMAMPLLPELPARRANVLAPCGYSALADARTLRWPQFRAYFQDFLPQVLPLYDAAVYHSAAYQDFEFGQRLGLTNGLVIPNGTDADEFTRPVAVNFREKYRIATRHFGLCVANYMPGKGQERVLECVRRLARPDFTMVFIGRDGGTLAALKAQAAGLNARFLTGIPREDTVAAFRSADVFLFGSHVEASPLVILEAKAARLPFVSTDCGNVREWQGGIVCAPEEMAAHTAKLLNTPQLHAELAEAGHREWKEKLTWDAVVDQWEDLYLRLAHACPQAGGSSAPSTVSASQPAATEAADGGCKPSARARTVVLAFSKDRALQLDATLRSFHRHCRDAASARVRVLFHAGDDRHRAQYAALAREHPAVEFIAERAFKTDLLAALNGAEEVLFLVDDNLFVRSFALAELRAALAAEPRALGYSLRLGRNTTYCYALDRAQALPGFTGRDAHALAFDWPGAACDFGYPLEVSSSLYRLAELRPLLESLDYKNPNTLEARLAESAGHFRDSHPLLLCAPQSLAFCAPVNKVQATFANRAGAEAALSAEALADRFAAGERVDVAAYDGFTPNACHQEVELRLARQAGAQPLVSVVIPCFKQAHLLPEAVASVVAQSFAAWEILIVNDGSPDDTAAVAERLACEHPGRCIRLLNQANQGLATARNHGIAATRGKYILPLDADDALAPDFLAQTVAVLEAEPDIHIVYTDLLRFGDAEGVFHTGEFVLAKLAVLNQLNYCSLYRREVFTAVGGYNANLVWGYEDWDFWIGAAERGFKARKIAAPLFRYRIRAGSMLSMAAQRDAELRARIVLNHPKLYDAASREQAAHIWARVAAEAAALRPAVFGQTTAAPIAPIRAESKPASTAPLKLRVTYLIESILGVTGGNQTLLRQAEELRRRGHDVTIVTRTERPAWFQFQVRVVRAPGGRPLAEAVPDSDVVISTYFTNTHELVGLAAPVKIYYAQGDQYVFDDATLPDTEQHRMLRQLSRLSYQAPGVRFVANSHHLAGAVERAAGRKTDAILPVCTDQTIFRPLPRALPGSKPRILVVGPDARGTREEPLSFKGLAEIHDALVLLAKRCPHFTVVRVSGTGPEIFAKFPCEFHLAPPDELKTFLFGTADVLIYASHYDSCPRPPQEAMAAGAAVVCTDTPGAREYCRDGENCLLVPVRAPEAIADAVERLLRDRALRERLVAGGLATAKEFPREREWDELEVLLRRLVAEAATPANEARATTTVPLQAIVSPSGDSASTGPAPALLKLPPVALLGDLQSARAALARREHPVAWTECLAALAVRPFHPEAWLLLAEVARAGDDGAMARECAARAHQLAPRWEAARRFQQSLPAEGLDWQVRWPAALPKAGVPQLTIFVIARNEEQFLPQCLASVRGLADQLIVVDTGSTDRTVAIAREHGAEVVSHPWADDFSAARNAALEHATGDWVLFLDADEELPAAEHDRLRADMAAPEVLAVRLRLENVGQEEDGVCHVPRLWRNAPGLFFHGRVHEQVFPSILVKCEAWGLETRLGTATLRHHGYRPDVVRDRNKVERNLRLLCRAVEELPGEPMLLMNLGLELVRAGDPRAGLAQYREAFERLGALPPRDVVPELREALLTQFVCHLHTAREFAEVLRVLASPLAEAGGLTASMHFMAALADLELKRFAEGAEHARQCLAKRDLPMLTPINRDIRKAGPHHVLALCLWGARRHEDVEGAFLAALAEDACARAPRLDFARWLAERGRTLDALHLLHGLVGAENDAHVWLLGARLALGEPQFIEFACDWTGEAVQHLPGHAGLAALRAEALLLAGRATAAHEWLAQAAAPTPAQAAACVLAALAGGLAAPTAVLADESAVSGEFLRWYRRLIEFGAEPAVVAVNERLEELHAVLPTAAGRLAAALAEATAA